VKVILCCESEILLQVAGGALEAAGIEVSLARDPVALVPDARSAAALLVDAGRARQAPRLLRDRGFSGRALLVGDADPAELAALARSLDLDGALPVAPAEEIGRRLTVAIESHRRVLIVDDSEITAKLLAEELSGKGLEVQYAPDAEKAATLIMKRQTRPDLILLDVNMPKVDGAQFCRFVKKNEMFRSIKVVFCSAEERSKVERLVAECGADGYISKDELLGKWISENA
jgi:CheY-like chemotaxis protein